jgi:anti-sigma regulatory factor (Ser/Thr protein kinase)
MSAKMLVRPDLTSVAKVRHEIAADLAGRSVAQTSVDDVVLVASELVGNAVLHGSGADDLDVAWDVQEGTVVVRVADASAAQPVPRSAGPTDTGGRGLTIVAAIADGWGVRRVARGKEVWARVRVRTSRSGRWLRSVS